MQLGLDFDDTIEELVDDLFTVGLESLVEFFELLFGFLVYGGLRAGGGTLVLCEEKATAEECVRCWSALIIHQSSMFKNLCCWAETHLLLEVGELLLLLGLELLNLF